MAASLRINKLALVGSGVAVGAILVFATTALGVTGHHATGHTLAPDVQFLNLAKAQVLAKVSTPSGALTLAEAPTTTGKTCMILDVGNAQGLHANGGSVCNSDGFDAQGIPISVLLTWLPSASGGYTVVVAGHVRRDVASLSINQAGAVQQVRLVDGFYLASFHTDRPGALPADGAPYALLGSDGSGGQIANLDLRQVVSRATPPASAG